MKNLLPIVSIIIPVFNAEDTLLICLTSLESQTYAYLELLFVNDCSVDNSVALIKEFATKWQNDEYIRVKILQHERNKGVAAARNTGLDQATGEYIYYVDADDSMESDTIEIAVKTALENEADIVGLNWFLTFQQNERQMNQTAFNTPWQAISLILSGKMRWNLWLFLTKRSLYENNKIRFIPGKNMGEDLVVSIKLFTCAQKVIYMNKACYHYGQSNSQSLTKTYSDQHIREVTENVKEVETYLMNSKFGNDIGNLLFYLKLNIKLPLLVSAKTSNYKRWIDWFPEANPFVLRNKSLPFRTRILQWLAVNRQYWALKLYYRLVIQVFYGVLYK
ncbi:glycosyltransferase family 2 protein [Mucilaginibacter lappiensis]|uniref:Glycosyltransferase involved in cell wall biosynthesis n=1 Tax=Mucilaginibacter lappiensis TaxID=354630 RepID=A0A841JIJ1_9SPHI|nr:glycosyltransferase family 2 protein [Mucilaginibacter lappiensis]MBB6130760.1 glycosyltransferase involved in cell wall biosynthesis [Mucilaginibacter lappiensis]